MSVENPLTEGDLEGAAFLCLASAAMTDRDQFPPGSGGLICDTLHERRRRFERAAAMVREGTTSLPKLGLSSKDCAWAADMAQKARDPEGWLLRFQTAEDNLRHINA